MKNTDIRTIIMNILLMEGVTIGELARELDLSYKAVEKRLKYRSGDIRVSKAAEILEVLNYRIVIRPDEDFKKPGEWSYICDTVKREKPIIRDTEFFIGEEKMEEGIREERGKEKKGDSKGGKGEREREEKWEKEERGNRWGQNVPAYRGQNVPTCVPYNDKWDSAYRHEKPVKHRMTARQAVMKARIYRGVTYEQMGKKMGMSKEDLHRNIASVGRGDDIRMELLLRCCNALDYHVLICPRNKLFNGLSCFYIDGVKEYNKGEYKNLKDLLKKTGRLKEYDKQ